MRKVYPIIILLVLLGAAISFMIMPNDKEVSLIVFKEQIDSRYAEVEANYRKRLAEGEVTVDVVMPLVKLYLESGAVDKAIGVMEQFVVKNPTNVEARKQLGTLYQYAQRPDDYLRNLEELNKLDGNREILKTLSDIYSFNGQHEKQAEVLRELIKRNERLEPQQVLDLANILAANKKNDEAIKTLQSFAHAHPEAMSFDSEELLVSLLMDKAQYDEAFKEASSWRKDASKPENKENIKQMARLVNILHFKGSPKTAQKLLSSYKDDVFRHPVLLHEQVLLYLSFGQEDKAYTILDKLYQSAAFPDELLDSYLLLAVKRHDEARVAELSKKITADNIDEIQAISLVELSLNNKRPMLLKVVKERLNTPEYRESHPLFSIVLGLALGEKDSEAKIEHYMSAIKLTESQQLTIARNCVYAQKKACAERFLKEFTQDKKMTIQKVAAAGNLYLDLKRYDDGLAFIEKNRAVGNSTEIENVWVRLAAANGKEQDVSLWMEKNPESVTTGLLNDIYFLAFENRHYEMAAAAAMALRGQSDTREARNMLAHAYTRQGKFADAMALFKADGVKSQEDADDYLGALIAMAAKDATYRRELGDFAAKQLQDPKVSESRKISLLYALIDAKRLDVAMPYVKEFAERKGGKWVYIYAENLDRQGMHDQAREFWIKAAMQDGVTHKERREIAFRLLDKGYRDDAEDLFKYLAEHSATDGEDVQQLLYIWGPRPSEDQLEWLYARAKESNGAVRDEWMNYIRDFSSSESMVNLVADHPEMIRDTAMLQNYVAALNDLGYSDHMLKLVDEVSAAPYTPEHVRVVSRFALEHNMFPVAQKGYTQLLKTQPKDEEALRELGTMAMDAADYSEAKIYLKGYLDVRKEAKNVVPESYLSYFNYAQILRAEGYDEKARPFYETAMKVVDAQKKPSADMQAKRLEAMAFLGREKEATTGFAALVAQYPDDALVRAEYISTLVEMKNYKQARKLLKQPAPDVAELPAGEPLRIAVARGYTAYRLVADRREVLFAFDPTRKPSQPLTESEIKGYPWLSFVNEGYDRTLLSLKEEYRAEVVAEKDGSVVIIPHAYKGEGVNSLSAQTRLRYTLLKARVELEDGKPQKAVDLLKTIENDYKMDSQYLGFMANAENYAGRWPRALRLLREAQALAPNNEDIAVLKRDIERTHAQHIKLDHEWRQLGDHDEQITTVTGFATVSEGWDVGVMAQHDNVKSGDLQRADGRFGSFKDTKQNGEIFVRHTSENGTMLKGSLFANNDVLGGGLVAGFVNVLGQTVATVEWQRPFVEYVEGVLDDATRDRVNIDHTARLNSKILVSADVGANRYNVKGFDDVSRSISVGVQASYELMDDSELSFVYGLDAEYEVDHQDGFADGSLYRQFPLRSTEIHSFGLAGHHDFARDDTLLRTYAEWMIGYAIDRLGGRGPVAEVQLTHELTEQLEAQARAAYGIGQGQSTDDVLRVGGYVMYRY